MGSREQEVGSTLDTLVRHMRAKELGDNPPEVQGLLYQWGLWGPSGVEHVGVPPSTSEAQLLHLAPNA